MKVAFVTGGQPRFTPDFTDFLQQVQNVDQADMYAVFWKSEWAETEDTARKKIEKILPPNWKLAGLKIVDEPEFILPNDAPPLEPPRPENVAWWYKRCFNQCHSLYLASKMVPDEYDYVARFRVDCSLDRHIDFDNIKVQNELLIPNNANAGWPDFLFIDQFFLGRYDLMMKFFSLGNIEEFPFYVKLGDPYWYQNPIGTWRGEFLSGTFLKHNRISVAKGSFNSRLNTYGRSRFTDKHYHHGIAPDPTE